jgi:hypothetical protein
MQPAMLKTELHNRGTNEDPVPTFATSAEIEVAEQLRHQLEERYLVLSAAPPSLPTPSNDGR